MIHALTPIVFGGRRLDEYAVSHRVLWEGARHDLGAHRCIFRGDPVLSAPKRTDASRCATLPGQPCHDPEPRKRMSLPKSSRYGSGTNSGAADPTPQIIPHLCLSSRSQTCLATGPPSGGALRRDARGLRRTAAIVLYRSWRRGEHRPVSPRCRPRHPEESTIEHCPDLTHPTPPTYRSHRPRRTDREDDDGDAPKRTRREHPADEDRTWVPDLRYVAVRDRHVLDETSPRTHRIELV